MYSVLSTIPILFSVFKDSRPYKITMQSTKEIISRLKFIGKLKKGEKINVKHLFVQPVGVATSISRTFINIDTKENASDFVKDIIMCSFKIFEDNYNSNIESDKTVCRNLIVDLNQVKIGISNFKETYIDFVKFGCDMDTIIQEIDVKLIEFERKINSSTISGNGHPRNNKPSSKN